MKKVCAAMMAFVLFALSSCGSAFSIPSSQAPATSSTVQRSLPKEIFTTAQFGDRAAVIFLYDNIAEVTSFSAPPGAGKTPAKIYKEGNVLYYLSYDSGIWRINRRDLVTEKDTTLYETSSADIASFVVLNEDEILLMVETDHVYQKSNGEDGYRQAPYLYNRKNNTLISFVEKIDLEGVPADGIIDITYYNGDYYFGMAADENFTGYQFCRVRAPEYTVELLYERILPNYYIDSGNLYSYHYATIERIKFLMSALKDSVEIEKWLMFEICYLGRVTGDTLLVAAADCTGEVVEVNLTTKQATSMGVLSQEKQEGFSYLPAPQWLDDKFYYAYSTPLENSTEKYWRKNYTNFCNLDGTLTKFFYDTKIYDPTDRLIAQDGNTLYYLLEDKDQNHKTIRMQLLHVEATR